MKPAISRMVLGQSVCTGWALKVPEGCDWFFGVGDARVRVARAVGERQLFAAVAWRSSPRGFVEVRRAHFAIGWKARDRAWKWVCAKTGRRFRSLHRGPSLSKSERRRRAEVLRRNAS